VRAALVRELAGRDAEAVHALLAIGAVVGGRARTRRHRLVAGGSARAPRAALSAGAAARGFAAGAAAAGFPTARALTRRGPVRIGGAATVRTAHDAVFPVRITNEVPCAAPSASGAGRSDECEQRSNSESSTKRRRQKHQFLQPPPAMRRLTRGLSSAHRAV